MKKSVFFVMTLLILTVLACSFNVSTATIDEAKMAKDAEGNQPATTFAQDEPFYAVVVLKNAPIDTKVKAIWTAVEVEGESPNTKIDEVETTSGDGQIHFDLTNDKLWPAGKYKVELYLNDKLDRTLEFQVEGSAAAQSPTPTEEPSPTSEPTKESSPTPKPTKEPSPTPKPTEESVSTESATVEPTSESAAGDTLVGVKPTTEPTVEVTTEPLPFKEEPYTHPSGAFTFAVPENFKAISDDKNSVSFGDNRSAMGAAFTDVGTEMSDKEMQDFIASFLKSFMANIADDYKTLEQKVQPDDSIYVALSYTSKNGDGDADFFFEQRDTVAFVLYFVTTAYDEMQPTWNEIIDSYSVDPEAALAAQPAAEPTLAPTPEPTQPPTPAGPAIPAGKGMLIYYNMTGEDFVIDIIGPTNTSMVVPPNSQKEFILDPGHYKYNGHSPGGRYTINTTEFDIVAGQITEKGVQ